MPSLSKIKTLKGEPKPKKRKIKDDKETTNQYGLYSGIVTDEGTKENPTESEAIINMANYMKNNMPPAANNPSNVYRTKFTHLGVNYNRKRSLKDV